MVPFIKTSPDGSEGVRCGQEEELGHVEHVEEFGTIADIEPHPVSVRLQTDGLQAQELEEVRAATRPPMSVRLVLVEETAIVLLGVVVVGVGAPSTRLITHI